MNIVCIEADDDCGYAKYVACVYLRKTENIPICASSEIFRIFPPKSTYTFKYGNQNV